jgi:hypothetical protein
MHYQVTISGNDFYIYLDGESQITSDGMLKGEIIKKNTAGDYIKTGRKVIIKDWVMLEVIGETKEGL